MLDDQSKAAMGIATYALAEGALVFAKACELGLGGIVSKRAGSRYRSGTTRNWLKCLNRDFQRR